MTDEAAGSHRGEAVAILVVYVVPLLLTSAGLWAVGLQVLAVALLAVEAVVVAAVVVVRRRPAAPHGTASPNRVSDRPWLVPTAMVAALLVIVAVAALAAAAG